MKTTIYLGIFALMLITALLLSGNGLSGGSGASVALAAATPTISPVNADRLDNQHGAYYRNAANLNAGTLSTARYSAWADLAAEGYLGNASGDLARNNGILQAMLNADLLDGKHATGFVGARQVNSITSDMLVNGTVKFADWASNSCGKGQVPQWNNTAWVCADMSGVSTNADTLDGLHASAFWQLGGNPLTATGIFGITSNNPLDFVVNNLRALRLEPNDISPNVIGGFNGNWVTTGAVGAAIGGGGQEGVVNRVTDNYGTIGGGLKNQAGDNAGETDDHPYNTVGGGAYNTASGWAATVSGGWGNVAHGDYSIVSGGYNNNTSEDYAAIGGGQQNTASGFYATIGGGLGNTASDRFATIGGGLGNTASNYGATVGGGGIDGTDVAGNSAGGPASTIGGGMGNTIDPAAIYATVGGGWGNSASGPSSTIGGGESNIASDGHATVAGGTHNNASYQYATISGGGWNIASYGYTTVCGGYGNTASGNVATVCGGELNTAAGDFSFVAGHRATNTDATHDGVFLFADSNDFDFPSATANEFAARATGGVRFISGIDDSGNPTAGVSLASGSGSWSSLSDRNLKANFSLVDGNDILAALAKIPITTWNYTAQDASIRHIGPMAQDFSAAFGVGEDNLHISTVDADGVALAGIQGLYQLAQKQAGRTEGLESRVAALEGRAGVHNGNVTVPLGWLLFGGLGLVNLGLVAGRRWRRKM